MTTILKRIALFAALGVSLVGCADYQAVKGTTAGTNKDLADTSSYIKQAQQIDESEDNNVTVHHDGFYVPLVPIEREKSEPAVLRCEIAYHPIDPVSIDDVAQRVSESTSAAPCNSGVSVHITSDAQQLLSGALGQRAMARAGGSTGGSAAAPNPSLNTVPAPPVNALTGGPGASGAGASWSQFGALTIRNTVTINFSGQLKNLLDSVTGQLGLAWRYDDSTHTVTIFYTESRTFDVDAIASDINLTSSVQAANNTAAGDSSGGGGGGSSGGSSGGISGTSTSTSTAGVTTKSSTTTDIKASVDAELTPGVGSDSPISASTGTITVTDTPEALDRVANMLANFNHRLVKQARFSVVMITYTANDLTDNGFNLTALYSNLASHYNIGIASAYQANSASTTSTINVLNGNSHWSTSQAVVNALNQQGHASVRNTVPVSTLNLQPASVQVAENEFYLASSSVTGGTTTGSASQSALTPGSFTVGYNLQLLPFMLSDSNNILLQFNMNLSSLKQLRTITSDGSSIEAPDINERLISQKVRLQPGQTLMLTGFQQDSLQVNRQGTGLPGFLNYIFGGGVNTNNEKDTIVVLITPTDED
jgi:type IVB pilus formation R64 PilN family outer membrane protein